MALVLLTIEKKGGFGMAKKKKEIEVTVAEVVDYLRIKGRFAPALREVVERKITAEAARKKGIKLTRNQLQKASEGFRIVNGLHKASDTERWLKANGLTIEALEEFLETNLLLSKFKDQLSESTGKNKYLASPRMKESMRDLIYQGWMEKQL
jgi:hypothetical protein